MACRFLHVDIHVCPSLLCFPTGHRPRRQTRRCVRHSILSRSKWHSDHFSRYTRLIAHPANKNNAPILSHLTANLVPRVFLGFNSDFFLMSTAMLILPFGVVLAFTLTRVRLPVWCSSDPPHTPLKPGVFYCLEDLGAVDFREGRAWRQACHDR